MNTIDRMTQALALDESGAWNGRQVSMDCDYDRRLGGRVMVRIAAVSQSRLRISHEEMPGIRIGGPPSIEYEPAPSKMALWADEINLVERVFGDAALRERLEIAIMVKGDSVEIYRGEVRVWQSTKRFDSDYTAYWAAWRTATAIIEHLCLGIPDGGTLPWWYVEAELFP